VILDESTFHRGLQTQQQTGLFDSNNGFPSPVPSLFHPNTEQVNQSRWPHTLHPQTLHSNHSEFILSLTICCFYFLIFAHLIDFQRMFLFSSLLQWRLASHQSFVLNWR